MSEILEDTGKRVSGGHALLLCICHECGSNFEIQRRRFSQLKPCLRCLRKKQKAYKPFYAKIEELEHKLEIAIETLEFYGNIDSWYQDDMDMDIFDYTILPSDVEQKIHPKTGNSYVAGKRARQVLEQLK